MPIGCALLALPGREWRDGGISQSKETNEHMGFSLKQSLLILMRHPGKKHVALAMAPLTVG